MRQSDDVSEYVARLLGEEEERTMLHVPISASRKGGAAAAPQPAGLTARPARRSSAESLPSVGDDDVEFRTEMARPQDILGATPLPIDPSSTGPIQLGADEDEEEPTAIRTQPGRPSGLGTPLAPPVPTRSLPRLPTGESTVQERPARAAAVTPPRPMPVRKPPVSSPSVAALDRRRGPPVDMDDQDEVDDESSQSVSVTPATVNSRLLPGRAAPMSRDDDSQVEDSQVEDSHVDTHSDVSDLLDPTTQPLRAQRDPEDDESTAGYGGHTQTQTEAESPPRRRSRLGLVLFTGVMLLLVTGAAAAWLFLFDPSRPGGPEAPVGEAPAAQEPAPGATAENTPSAESPGTTGETPPAEPTPEPGSATASPTPVAEQGSASPTPTPTTPTPPTPGTEQGSAAVPPGTEPLSAGAVAKGGAKGPDIDLTAPTLTPPPKPPAAVSVQFKAPARTVLKVQGKGVKPNDSLKLAPGTVRIDYRCPGNRAPKGRKDFTVPENPTEPVVFKLDCRQKSRR
jgi:serine/threonine-protein kinase